ncbi:MAG: response regulator [Rhodoferax sp.]|nr:response regulator [Rhodoferax sp.]
MIAESEICAAHILIVDDQPANVELLRHMLEDSGYTHIDATHQPQEVCRLHQENCYDLILLDLQMPGMDGFAVMAALRAQLQGVFLPVIVITAQPAHKLQALQCGARDFISKPFDVTELRTRIRNTLEICLLYHQLAHRNEELEARVQERTAQLRESEARFRSLTELASDWYWEQDDNGVFTKITGPVRDMLDVCAESLDAPGTGGITGWDAGQHAQLKAHIAAREPFLDFILCRTLDDGSQQCFKVCGEPMLNRWNKYIGYRGVGLEVTTRH